MQQHDGLGHGFPAVIPGPFLLIHKQVEVRVAGKPLPVVKQMRFLSKVLYTLPRIDNHAPLNEP